MGSKCSDGLYSWKNNNLSANYNLPSAGVLMQANTIIIIELNEIFDDN